MTPLAPSVQMPSAASLASAIQSQWGLLDDRSFDPYDGLEVGRVLRPLLRAHAARLALVQVNKRSPVNLRPLFGIRPTANSYTAAHLASACLRLGNADAARPRL